MRFLTVIRTYTCKHCMKVCIKHAIWKEPMEQFFSCQQDIISLPRKWNGSITRIGYGHYILWDRTLMTSFWVNITYCEIELLTSGLDVCFLAGPYVFLCFLWCMQEEDYPVRYWWKHPCINDPYHRNLSCRWSELWARDHGNRRIFMKFFLHKHTRISSWYHKATIEKNSNN